MDLYFEILRENKHIICSAKDTCTVLELKKIIEGILKYAPEDQTLKKKGDDSRWTALPETETLAALGFTTKNAKADEPATLVLGLKGDDGEMPYIAKLSSPPPLPPAMINDNNTDA